MSMRHGPDATKGMKRYVFGYVTRRNGLVICGEQTHTSYYMQLKSAHKELVRDKKIPPGLAVTVLWREGNGWRI